MKKKLSYTPPYTVSGKAMTLMTEIAAAVERYRIAMEGPTGRLWQTALLGKWRPELYAAPVENIVWAHQREYYAAIRRASADGDSGSFIDFMLDKILRTLKAKGRAYVASLKSDQKKRVRSDQKTSRKVTRKEPRRVTRNARVEVTRKSGRS